MKSIKVVQFIALLYILFISMFALDVLSLPSWPIALIIHLIPSILLIIGLLVSFKNPIISAWIFVVFGFVIYFITKPQIQNTIIWGPPIIIGLLFFISQKREIYKKGFAKKKK